MSLKLSEKKDLLDLVSILKSLKDEYHTKIIKFLNNDTIEKNCQVLASIVGINRDSQIEKRLRQKLLE